MLRKARCKMNHAPVAQSHGGAISEGTLTTKPEYGLQIEQHRNRPRGHTQHPPTDVQTLVLQEGIP